MKRSQASDGALSRTEAYLEDDLAPRRPNGVSPVVGALARELAWAAGEGELQDLIMDRTPQIAVSRGGAIVETERSFMALDWYCRVAAAEWLRSAGWRPTARAIEALAPIRDGGTAAAVAECLNVVHAQTERWAGRYKARACAAIVEGAREGADVLDGVSAEDLDETVLDVEGVLDGVLDMCLRKVEADQVVLAGAKFGAAWAPARRASEAAGRVACDAAWKLATRALAEADEVLVVDYVDEANFIDWEREDVDDLFDLFRASVDAAVDTAWAGMRYVQPQLQESALDLLDRMIAAGAE